MDIKACNFYTKENKYLFWGDIFDRKKKVKVPSLEAH